MKTRPFSNTHYVTSECLKTIAKSAAAIIVCPFVVVICAAILPVGFIIDLTSFFKSKADRPNHIKQNPRAYPEGYGFDDGPVF